MPVEEMKITTLQGDVSPYTDTLTRGTYTAHLYKTSTHTHEMLFLGKQWLFTNAQENRYVIYKYINMNLYIYIYYT